MSSLSRRDVVKATSGTIAASAMVGSGVGTSVAAAAAQYPENTIVVGLVAEPTSLDPQHVTDINSMRVQKSIFDSLLDFEPGTFNLIPSLAVEWSASEDGLEYDFVLREGVTFHDGTPFNGDAVKCASSIHMRQPTGGAIGEV